MEYFNVVTTYEFNLNKFLKEQEKINKKFPCPYENINQIIDIFIIAIIEEVYEARIVCNKDEYFKELVDVIMYLGSFYNEIKKYEFDLYKDDKEYFNCLDKVPEFLKVSNNMDSKRYIEYDFIINELMKIRRYFPERKYHKKFDKNAINPNRFENIRHRIIKIIKMIFDSFVYEDFSDFDKRIKEKQNYIESL